MGKFVEAERKRKKEFVGDLVRLAEHHVAAGPGTIEVSVAIPSGYKINDAAPFYIGCSPADSAILRIPSGSAENNVPNPKFPLKIPATFSTGSTDLEIDLVVYYCAEKEESLCLIKQLKLVVPVTVSSQGSDHVLQCEATVR